MTDILTIAAGVTIGIFSSAAVIAAAAMFAARCRCGAGSYLKERR